VQLLAELVVGPAQPAQLGLGPVELRRGHHEAQLRQEVPLARLQAGDAPVRLREALLQLRDLARGGVHLGQEDLDLGAQGDVRLRDPQPHPRLELVQLLLQRRRLPPARRGESARRGPEAGRGGARSGAEGGGRTGRR
jgi:hypothetical protein